MAKKKTHVFECGCCGCYHPIDFWGDCRDDSNRFDDVDDERFVIDWTLAEAMQADEEGWDITDPAQRREHGLMEDGDDGTIN